MPTRLRAERARRSSRRAVPLLIALVVGILAGPAAPGIARAARGCDSSPGNYHAGYTGSESAVAIEGTSTSLTYRTADVCIGLPGSGQFFFGWTAIAGALDYQYAQSGFYYDGNPLGCTRHFAQQSNVLNGYVTKTGSCVGGGEVHHAWEQYVPFSGGHVRSNIDTTVFLESTFNELNWQHPWRAQFSGEVGNMQDDIPGLSTSKTDFSTAQIQYFSDNVYRTTCSHITLVRVVQNSRWSADAPACDHLRAWTNTP
jgi:hypothetical protein